MTLLFTLCPPMRPCGLHKRTELNTPALRATGAAREGDSWELHRTLAWRLCWKCHSCDWTYDKRRRKSAVPGVRPKFGTRKAAGERAGSEQEPGMAQQSQPRHAPWPVEPAKSMACRARPKQRMHVYCLVQNLQVLLVNVW